MEPIATIPTTYGWAQVSEDDHGQFVLVDGERRYGQWLPDPENYDVPIIVGPDLPPFE